MPVVFIDGQSVGNEQRQQPRRARIAFIFQRSDGGAPSVQNSKVFFKEIGDKTNNEAEYHALLAALSYISSNVRPAGSSGSKVRIFADSRVVVSQVNGDWKAQQPHLRQLQQKAMKRIVELGLPRLVWVPREENYAGRWLEGKWKVPGEVITWSYY